MIHIFLKDFEVKLALKIQVDFRSCFFLAEKKEASLHFYYACHLRLSSLFRTLPSEFMSAWETTPNKPAFIYGSILLALK